jgi:hypothetical protein
VVSGFNEPVSGIRVKVPRSFSLRESSYRDAVKSP